MAAPGTRLTQPPGWRLGGLTSVGLAGAELGAELGKPEVSGERGESNRAGASTGGVGECGEVAGGQLGVAQPEVVAFGHEPAQPAHGRALIADRLLLEDQQADGKRVVEWNARELRGGRPNASEVTAPERALEDRVSCGRRSRVPGDGRGN